MSDLGESSFHNRLNDNTENKQLNSHSSNRRGLSYERIYQGHKETQLLHPKYQDTLSLSAIDKGYTQDDISTIKSAIERDNPVRKVIDEMIAIERSGSHIVGKDSKKPFRSWPDSIVQQLNKIDFSKEGWKDFLNLLRDEFPGKEHESSRWAVRRFVQDNAKSVVVDNTNRIRN